VDIWYRESGEIKNKLLRSTLKKVEESTKEFDIFLRCHRSYIVNVNHITKMNGNSQGYVIEFSQISVQAPVSQKYIEEFKEKIQLIRP
jgi:DNA-binding LytR/AlgR family response regulator